MNITPTKKYVLYEGLKMGNRFFTLNDPKVPESEKIKLSTGEIVYKILGYADSTSDAQLKLYGRTFE